VSESLLERARDLLEANTQSAQLNGRRFVFTVPSARAYPFQWFWDSCFHAIVWSRIDIERAKDELRSLLSAQTEEGLLPHVIFWNRDRVSRFSFHHLESAGRLNFFLPGRPPRVSAQMQPPVIAQAVEEIVAVDGDAFLAEALPPLERYYRYLASSRDPDLDGLITIISQFESGLDFSPAYDRPSRGKPASAIALGLNARLPQIHNKLLGYDLDRMLRLNEHQFEDVLVNSIYADGLQALSRLAGRAGKVELERWALSRARETLSALIDRCYDERRGLFFNLSGRSGQRRNEVKTVISLAPLLLNDLPAAIVDSLVDHLTELPPRLSSRRPPVDLARAMLNQHELAPRTRASPSRSRGARRAARRPFPGAGRAGRLQRVLRPAQRPAGRRRALRLGDARSGFPLVDQGRRGRGLTADHDPARSSGTAAGPVPSRHSSAVR
jgi:hypothetical protein